jgi:hypothetical protein
MAGIDRVGLASDFDGATMPIGMEDPSKLPRITEALLQKGYSKQDIGKNPGRQHPPRYGTGRISEPNFQVSWKSICENPPTCQLKSALIF